MFSFYESVLLPSKKQGSLSRNKVIGWRNNMTVSRCNMNIFAYKWEIILF